MKKNIFCLIFFCLLIVVFSRVLFLGVSNQFLFNDFLTMLQDVSQFQVIQFVDLQITADWGVFNFFKSFLNIFSGFLSLLVFVGANLVNCVLFVIGFLKYMIGF